MKQLKGCITALVSPMNRKNQALNQEALVNLIEYQKENNISGILAIGTTGESTTLNQREKETILCTVSELTKENCISIAGTGCNNTSRTIKATRFASEHGYEYALLVDPYYNGPSSMEIRREYITPVASKFPEMQLIPYVIPGRSGTQLLPQDLALLHQKFENISAVKDATGNLENMRITRDLCGKSFAILSGDDNLTFDILHLPEIKGQGVISVFSNVFPKAIAELVDSLLKNDFQKAEDFLKRLQPFFNLVTIKTEEHTTYGSTLNRARNPLPVKTLMELLGMDVGFCRQPLGRLTRKGLDIVQRTAQGAYETTPELFEPIEEFFDVDLGQRLYGTSYLRGLAYD